jgi:putative DNA primase/helicase
VTYDPAAAAKRMTRTIPAGPLREVGTLSLADSSMTDAVLAVAVTDAILRGEYCWAAGLGWMRWDGKRWERCEDVTVIEPVREHLAALITQQLTEIAADDFRLRNGLNALLARNRITAVVLLARGILEVRSSDFDAHPDLLNTQTGIVDLRTGAVRPHDPELYFTKITAGGYRPGAQHPDWDAALKAVPGDCLKYFQTRLGQAVTGYMTPDDVMLLCRGGGENGKSTVLGTINISLGDYCVLLSDRVLMAEPNSHPTEMMALRGARMAIAEELPEARRLSVKRLKDCVGTSPMTARYMRQDSVVWDPTHSIFISTNYLPVVEETDHGTWRRLMVQEFPYKFLKPHEDPTGAPNELPGDPGLRERLKGSSQQEAVLAWLVEGAGLWYAAGKVMPEAPERIRTDVITWRRESDLILGYWLDRVRPDADSHVLATDLLADFNTWLGQRNLRSWADRLFTSRFGDHDETKKHRAEHKRIRQAPGLDRPQMSGSVWQTPPPVPDMYMAWVGIGFQKGL